MNCRFKIIWLMVFSLVLISCTPPSTIVEANFINIDTADDDLKIRFSLGSEKETEIGTRILGVRVYDNGTLVVALSGAVAIDDFIYPSIPDGFEITYPENGDSLPVLDKNKSYSFHFSGEKDSSNFMFGNVTWGQWDYVAFYSDIEGRWLFDEEGSFRHIIEVDYISCIGKDVVEVCAEGGLLVDDDTFYIIDDSGSQLPCKYKIKKYPINKIELTVLKDQKTGTKLRLFIKRAAFMKLPSRSGYYEYRFEVPKSNSIRL